MASGLFVALQATGERPEAKPLVGIPIEFIQLLEKLKSGAPADPASFLSLTRDSVGDDFTVALRSESAQGEHRAVLFPNLGKVINTIGQNGSIEGVMDTDGPNGTVPYEITFHPPKKAGDKPAHSIQYSPTTCVQCHTEQHVYIWRRIPSWPAFVGGDNDAATKTDHATAFADPILKPLQTKDGVAQPFPYPYLATVTEPKLSAMPNTRLSLLVISRATRSLWNRVRSHHPDRYLKYAPLLLRTLVCETKTDQEDVKVFLADYQKAFPRENAIWEEAKNSLPPARALSLKILHFLGMKPHQIILTEPWDEKDPLASSANLKAMLETQFGFLRNDQLSTPLDFGLHASLGSRLSGLIAKEIGVKVPRELSVSLAGLREIITPNSDPFSSESQILSMLDNPEFLSRLDMLAPGTADIMTPLSVQNLSFKFKANPNAAGNFCNEVLSRSIENIGNAAKSPKAPLEKRTTKGNH